MKKVIFLVSLLALAACAPGSSAVWHPPTPDGQQQIDRYSTSSGDGVSPTVTTATVWVCASITKGPCELAYSASFGGKSVAGQVIEGVGTIVTPLVAAKIIGNAMSSQSDNTVVNSNASAEGGAGGSSTATGGSNTNTNSATGGSSTGGSNTSTITNTNGGTVTPPGSPL